MIYENIKNYFKQKKNEKQNLFVLELDDSEAKRYIIEQKVFELMLSKGYSVSSLIYYNFIEQVGKKFEKENITYERYKLSEFGNWLYQYDDTQTYGLSFIQAFYEIKNNTSINHLRREKSIINSNLKKLNLKSVHKFDEKILLKQNKETKNEQTLNKSL